MNDDDELQCGKCISFGSLNKKLNKIARFLWNVPVVYITI